MIFVLNEWNVLSNFVLVGGAFLVIGTIVFGVYCISALDKGRAVFPWSTRARVDKAEADVKVAMAHLQMQGVELQEMALSAKRDQLIAAIKDGNPITAELLKIPKAQIGDGSNNY